MDDAVSLRRNGQTSKADHCHGKDCFYFQGKCLDFKKAKTCCLFQESAQQAGNDWWQPWYLGQTASEDGKQDHITANLDKKLKGADNTAVKKALGRLWSCI